MQRCSKKAYAMCPTRHLCGPIDEATFSDDSECATFNREVEDKPMTNADRIRAMTDEELAVFMFSMVDCVSCENKLMNNGKLVFGEKRKTCTDKDYHAMCNGDGRKCEAVCLKWLQQPAEEV